MRHYTIPFNRLSVKDVPSVGGKHASLACGVEFLALRSVGYDYVDLRKAPSLGMKVVNVRDDSPYTVVKHENEKGLSFNDHRNDILHDQLFCRLRSFKNVIITAHQAFFTQDAIESIAATALANLDELERACRVRMN